MRLLFVTGDLGHGGAERQTITLANRLAERGHECHVAYIKSASAQLQRLSTSSTCLDARRYFDPAALRALASILIEKEPTHVVAANEYAMFYARLATWWARSPAQLAVTFHATVLQTMKERLKMAYYRPLFWTADWLVFVCEAQRRYWQRRALFARRTDVIYNGIDTEHWAPPSEAARRTFRSVLGFAETDLVVGMSAVLRPEKNPVQLVEALALVRRRGIAARALFIGDGPMRPAIEARAASLGLAREVVITGLQQDVRPLLAACDVVTLCSHSEALSLAALEALSLGRPVVHAEVGGAAEMIEPGRNGYLFAPGDTAALASHLATLADPVRRRRMAAPARATVETRFSERAMVERYESRLEQLPIGRKTRARSKRDNLRRAAQPH